MQSWSETRSIPVVVISADATRRQMERLRSAGAHDCLTKPIDVTQLLAILDEKLVAERNDDRTYVL